MKQILLLTTMYPTPLRPGTKVCHYFAREWVKMGYEVIVIHYRSMFPRIYTDLASMFPKLAYKYVGNHVEMDRNMNIVQHSEEGIPVYSIPIFKYFPHGAYSKGEIKKQVKQLKRILSDNNYSPDAIIGHFHNPQFQIIGALKKEYPNAKTCVSLHELSMAPIKNCYGEQTMNVLKGVDKVGFRSVPIKQRFEDAFGNNFNTLVCWSGTPQFYIDTPATCEREFKDGPVTKFLFVGQTIKRKYPRETIEAIHKAMGEKDYKLAYVGTKDFAYQETVDYVNANNLTDNVVFTGRIPRDEIVKYYDESECFVLISSGEVFGLVYLEAMSRGCITIAGKREGMEGIIENGVNGYLCEPGDVEELKSIINQINQLSAKEKKEISDKARKTATQLSEYQVAKTYLEDVIK